MLMGEGGTLGRVVLCVYFLCLIFAGISSNIAYMETVLRSAEDLGGRSTHGVIITPDILYFRCSQKSIDIFNVF